MNANEIYMEAYKAHYNKKAYESALNGYLRVIDEYPDSSEARYSEGQIKNLIPFYTDEVFSIKVETKYVPIIDSLIEKYKDDLPTINLRDKEKSKVLQAQQAIQEEQNKVSFANSFNEFYEYDVVTIINEDHGRIDKNNMMKILSEHAQQGWRLHSIYSNELGKNAIRVLGFGVNSTACEDVLIFERRIERLPES